MSAQQRMSCTFASMATDMTSERHRNLKWLSTGHSIEHLAIMVIKKIPEGDVQTKIGREKHEREWIGTLRTLHPRGMNR